MQTNSASHSHAVHRLPSVTDSQIQQLAEVLIDCVAGGASVSFMHPLPLPKALDFWHGVAAGVARGERALLVAQDADGIVGTVQLVLSQPDNQPHRADLAKMLVHRRARRRGLGRALFEAVCAAARRRGRTLLTFDTISGAEGEKLYLSCGCVKAGEIPGYALLPDGRPAPTSVLYKILD